MRRGSIEKGEGDEISEINVVPLADISLVLLIILMLITPMVMQSMIKVMSSRGAVRARGNEAPEKPLFVEVRPDAFYLNTNKMASTEDLLRTLQGELSRKDDRTVILTAAAGVRHGQMVTALDVSKRAGAERLSLLKRSKK